MNIKYKLLFILGLYSMGLNAQNSISQAELDYVKDRCQSLLGTYEYMTNFIGDLKTPSEERNLMIKESYSYVFLDDQVMVEDDLIQNRTKKRNLKIKDYLNNVYLYYKDTGVKFQFSNINISEVFRKEYMFALIYFDIEITGESIIENKMINNVHSRVAEVKLVKVDGYWEPLIANLRFPAPEDLQQNYSRVQISTEKTEPIQSKETRIESLEEKFDQLLEILAEEKSNEKSNAPSTGQEIAKNPPSQSSSNKTAEKTNTDSKQEKKADNSPRNAPIETSENIDKQGTKESPKSVVIKEESKAKNPMVKMPKQKKKLGIPITLLVLGGGSIGSSFIFNSKSDELYKVYENNLDPDNLVFNNLSRESHYQDANKWHHISYITKYGGATIAGIGAALLIVKLIKKDSNSSGLQKANVYYDPFINSFGAKINF